MAKKRKRSRKRYSAADRAKILAAAGKDKLTAADVERRFGVKPVTYYSWRKGAKGVTRKRTGAAAAKSGSGLTNAVRAEVQRHVRAVLPRIVREETERYLKEILG